MWRRTCSSNPNPAAAIAALIGLLVFLAFAAAADPLPPAASITLLKDIPYGSHAKQRMDVYLPASPHSGRPLIVMVHGGAWQIGDKAHFDVVRNKVARWVARGFVFVSVNYRLLPETAPLQQAEDVARALAAVEKRAQEWGADAAKIILMGHSAGAHLAALLTASPAEAAKFGARPWLGSVILDSAALDIPMIMEQRHLNFYDKAFGSQRHYWRLVSPYYRLGASALPMLAVCSSRHRDSCLQAERFARLAAKLGVTVRLLPQHLNHMQINELLGKPGAYTDAVEAFMGSLDPLVRQMLSKTLTAGATAHSAPPCLLNPL